ncbi:MAG: GEVED domain-containing protein, partial [Bacteroidia bacterium]
FGDQLNPVVNGSASIGINSAPGGAGNYLSVNATGTAATNSTETNNINVWPGLNTIYKFEKPIISNPPIADFTASLTTATTADNITLTDLSANTPTSWTWTITPATFTYVTGNANSQNPIVHFTAAGVYTVKLRVANVQGADSITKTNYITITPAYCNAAATNTADTDIGEFVLGTFSNGSATPVLNNPSATGTYSNFTALGPIALQKNNSYPISVSHITSGGTLYSSYIKVWIDYNQDFAFDASEVIFEGGTTSGNTTISGLVTVPGTALTGTTRLRIVQREGGSTTTTTACGTFSWGEVEDYTVDIQASAPCTNPPVPGTASGPNSVFPNDPAIYNLTGSTGDIQWQFSADGINFTNIGGATTNPDTFYYNTLGTYYIRALVTTPNCNPDSSNIITTVV